MGQFVPTSSKADNGRVFDPTDEKLLSVLEDYHMVQLEDDNYNEKLTWCLEHCQNKFRDINYSRGRRWYFQNEQDATMFSLKWA